MAQCPMPSIEAGPSAPAPPQRLLGRLREAIRVRHYSFRTEDAYADWVRRFIRFHGKRHPQAMGAAEVAVFLSAPRPADAGRPPRGGSSKVAKPHLLESSLAVDRHVAPSTQNQAKSALLFLYRQVLGIELPWLDEIVVAKDQRRLPAVLTPGEVRLLLQQLSGTMGLVASLLYGTGMRLLEGLRLRVKDIEFERRVNCWYATARAAKIGSLCCPRTWCCRCSNWPTPARCTRRTWPPASARCGCPTRWR